MKDFKNMLTGAFFSAFFRADHSTSLAMLLSD
jgi:hypothetical protein